MIVFFAGNMSWSKKHAIKREQRLINYKCNRLFSYYHVREDYRVEFDYNIEQTAKEKK